MAKDRSNKPAGNSEIVEKGYQATPSSTNPPTDGQAGHQPTTNETAPTGTPSNPPNTGSGGTKK